MKTERGVRVPCARVRLLAAICLAALLAFGLSALAQLPTGTILGTVRDGTGAVVPGTTVTVRDTDTGSVRTGTTGSDGVYRFQALPVGNYQVQVTHEGFKTVNRRGIVLTVAQEAVVDISLEVGSVGQSVDVTAEVPLVNTTSSQIGGLVTEEKLEELPLNGRNYMDLMLLQTGVNNVSSQEGHNSGVNGEVFTANGAPSRSNNFMLDGAIMQNYYGMNPSSISGTTLGLDGIKEYRIITNMFGAEYGLTMGSQTTMVSKGGTNQWHGDGFEYLRNSALEAAPFFYVPGAGNGFRRLPEFQRNQFGGSFGGPIKKDKTFFYGVYEGIRENLGLDPLSTVPAAACHTEAPTGTVDSACDATLAPGQTEPAVPLAAGLLGGIPSPNLPNNQFTFPSTRVTGENYGQMRVDHTFSNTDSAFARYTIDNTGQTKPLPFPGFDTLLGSRSQYVTLSENHIATNNLINTARLSFSRTSLNIKASDLVGPPGSNFVSGQGIGVFSIEGALGVVSGSGYGPANAGYKIQDVYTASDDIFYNHGRHSLQFGALVNRFNLGSNEDFFAAGNVVFNSMAQFLSGFTSGFTFTPPSSNDNRNYVYSTFGFYAQDQFRASSRLTLTLGLRYEFNNTARETNGRQYRFLDFPNDQLPTQGPVIDNPSLHNFSPRAGFAWDMFGNGKTSLRGGGGLFYDIADMGSALVQNALGQPPDSFQGGGFFPGVGTPLALPLDVNFPVDPSFQGAVISNANYYAKQPSSVQWNLTLDRQLPLDMGLSVSYVGSRGRHLWTVEEGNPALPTSIVNGAMFWDTFSPNYAPHLNPYWGDYTITETVGDSWYDSLQVELNKRLTHGLNFQSSYTWGKSLDTGQGQLPGIDPTTNTTTDPFHPLTDKGPSEYNIVQDWRFNLLYHLPSVNNNQGLVGKALSGWWMGNIVSIQSGFNFSPLVPLTANDSTNQNDRPDVVTPQNVAAIRNGTYMRNGVLGGANPNAVPFDPSYRGNRFGWFNPNMFIPGPPGFLGDAGRGILTGPGLINWDFSLVKDTKAGFLGESGNVEFRAEFFNLMNHPNFGLPDNSTYVSGPLQVGPGPGGAAAGPTLQSPTSGLINAMNGDPREIQFALRFEF